MFGENWNINKQKDLLFKLILAGKKTISPFFSLPVDLWDGWQADMFPWRLTSHVPEYRLSLKNDDLWGDVHIHVNTVQVLIFSSAYREPETTSVTNKAQLKQPTATPASVMRIYSCSCWVWSASTIKTPGSLMDRCSESSIKAGPAPWWAMCDGHSSSISRLTTLFALTAHRMRLLHSGDLRASSNFHPNFLHQFYPIVIMPKISFS